MNERREDNLSGGVTRLVYMCGYMLPVGRSVNDVIAENRIPPEYYPSVFNILEDGTIMPKDPASMFFNALDRNSTRVKEAVSHITAFPPGHFATKTSFAAWEHIPTTYIYSIDDNPTPPGFQWLM